MSILIPYTSPSSYLKLIVIICFLSDKKFRKMGGEDGLQNALHSRFVKSAERNNYEFLLFHWNPSEIQDLGPSQNAYSSSYTEVFLQEIRRRMSQMAQLDGGSFEYGQIDCFILHKVSDLYRITTMSKTILEDLEAWLDQVSNQEYDNVRFRVLDAPTQIQLLKNRMETGSFVQRICQEKEFSRAGLNWPAFTRPGATKDYLTAGSLALPIIMKPVDACATSEAHWMTLFWKNFDSNSASLPTTMTTSAFSDSNLFLFQTFYPHHGILYKVYVIGDAIEVVPRPSITLDEAQQHSDDSSSFRFNTHQFKVDRNDLDAATCSDAMARFEPHRQLVENFTRAFKSEIQLSFFGVDIIILEPPFADDIRVAVIDINYFPGFDGISDLPMKFLAATLKEFV